MQPIPQRQRAMNAYASASDTMAPALQIVMLYDSAIRRMREARKAIEDGRIEARYTAVMKAYAIANALHGCLDFEKGGEIAPLLDRYYRYIMARMTEINTRNDPAICGEIEARLQEMRESWATIAAMPEAQETPMPPASVSAEPTPRAMAALHT